MELKEAPEQRKEQRGFKLTDVGLYPVEWKIRKLGDLFEITSSKRVFQSEWKTAGIPFYRARELAVLSQAGRVDNKLFITEEMYNEFKARYGVPAIGDLLVTGVGTLGKVFVVRDNSRFYFKDGNIIWFKLAGALDPNYLQQLYLTRVIIKQIEDSAEGTTVGTYTITGAKKTLIPLPPTLAEQHAIATALSDVDGLIAGLEGLLAKKRALKQGAMQQLLSGQKRLPGFTGEWDELQVRDVILDNFSGPSPTCEERNIRGEREWGVLKTTAATWENGWDWRAHKTLPPVFWNRRHIELRKGDVIVTKAGPRHRVGVSAWIDYVPERIIPSGKMIALRPNQEKVVPFMLAHAIAAPAAQVFLDQRTTGMAESQMNFENDALLTTPIKLPKIKEQQAIAEVLSDFDADVLALEAKLGKTRLLKQGMMQELLTGRVRLV
jgi:type I restriction enzyme S subunit